METKHDTQAVRLDKLQKIKEMGIDPFPHHFQVTHSFAELHEQATALLEQQTTVSFAGRLMAIRDQGKAAFAHIQEQQERFQIYVRKDTVAEKQFELFKLCDIGDYLGLSGYLMMTKRGELTLRVTTLTLLGKSLRPLPITKFKEVDGEKIAFDEVTDKEFRYRQRYVDLVINAEVVTVFQQRALLMQTIRSYLIEQRFLEVETPSLQTIYGGAHATPFVTHHKALGIEFYLRISNELYLKRLVIGGLHRVFEFVKNFRNEGIDRTHNPEFTALEFYQAYADYEDMCVHCETIWEKCALALHGTTEFEFEGKRIDVKAPWRRLPMKECLQEVAKIDFDAMSDADIQHFMQERQWKLEGNYTRGRAMVLFFENLCEASLIQPIFITDYPKESSPLCKNHRTEEGLIERFEAYINGWEIANAYSELTDPIEQQQLFEEQVERGRGGEQETQPYDADYIRAMEYGAPPMGGIGFGIDRMVMLLANQSTIRDVILFPTMKPENFES